MGHCIRSIIVVSGCTTVNHLLKSDMLIRVCCSELWCRDNRIIWKGCFHVNVDNGKSQIIYKVAARGRSWHCSDAVDPLASCLPIRTMQPYSAGALLLFHGYQDICCQYLSRRRSTCLGHWSRPRQSIIVLQHNFFSAISNPTSPVIAFVHTWSCCSSSTISVKADE